MDVASCPRGLTHPVGFLRANICECRCLSLFTLLLQDEARRPVWLQLLEACLESAPDIPAVDILGPKLAEQLFLAEQLRQQLSDKQQQILEQQVIADQAA